MADKAQAPQRKAGFDGQKLAPSKTESTSPASSEDSKLFDNPEYISPNQQDILLMDVSSKILRTTISGELGVQYLSAAESLEPAPLSGYLHSLNKRLMVNVVTRRCSRRGGRTDYPQINVIFLCDTGTPNTFICGEATKVLLGRRACDGDVLRDTLFVQMSDFPAVETQLSPKGSRFEDVNVIGMDLMSHLKTTILGKDLEFKLENMEHSVN
jgi:hypothetical protein